MGYPENVLAPGERVVVHYHPHWKYLIWPTVGFLVGTAIAGVCGGLVSGSDLGSTTKTVLWIVIAVVWVALISWVFLRKLVTWWSTHFVVTDRRVMYRVGIITRSSIDIPMVRINSVEFRETLLDRLFGSGTLEIESASEDPLTFNDIPKVRDVHKLLYHEVLDINDPGGTPPAGQP